MVDDGQVSFHEAKELWGKPVSQTVDALEVQFGAAIHTAVIGPAGENLVRYASIVTERTYQAARMGMGAVMGSKKLKAIVLRGDRIPPVANPETCQAITERYRQSMQDNPTTRWQLEPPGFSCWLSSLSADRAVCAHNYRDGSFEGLDSFSAPQLYGFLTGRKVTVQVARIIASSILGPKRMQAMTRASVASTRISLVC